MSLGTRQDIRKFIRGKISGWPDVQCLLDGAITDSAVSLTIDASALSYISDRGLVEFLDGSGEVAQLQGIAESPANPLSVFRGSRETAASAHADDCRLSIHPFWGWTDDTLNGYITRAVQWLGQGMVWTLKPIETTWLAGFKEFGLPAGIVYPTGNIVKKLEFQDPTTGLFRDALGFTHRGDRIILNDKLVSNWVVRLWVQTKQANLTDDVTALDLDYAQECIELYAAARVMEELQGNRARYYDYSAALNDRASTLDELQRNSYYYLNQATILADKISRPGLAGYAPIQRS